MAALPYMQLYVADYLADTLHLDVIESGAYIHLLMNYWQTGKPLPDDDKRLARISKCTDEQWLNVRSTVAEFFQINGGLWTHKRVEKDLNKVRQKSSAAQKAGKASAEARAKKLEKSNTLNERSTDAQPTLNHTDTDTDTEKNSQSDRSETGPPDRLFDEPSASSEKPADLWLERIWSSREIYPHPPTHKGGKALTLKKLSKLSQSERTEFESWCRDYRAMLDLTDWLSPAMLATVLNQGRWREPIDLDAARAEALRRGGPGDQPAESKDFGKY